MPTSSSCYFLETGGAVHWPLQFHWGCLRLNSCLHGWVCATIAPTSPHMGRQKMTLRVRICDGVIDIRKRSLLLIDWHIHRCVSQKSISGENGVVDNKLLLLINNNPILLGKWKLSMEAWRAPYFTWETAEFYGTWRKKRQWRVISNNDGWLEWTRTTV